ncbi:hypothetical protein EJ08DRAFT_711846 [Tothia fuscella]|uniref:Uncharacterized protein n=1 Tax=Tothia fuscella TaxID=1048955 RepID=A0A9P4NUK3_9PEZI|nr:hypothetical protein EJ08DRAFT_711846 [Tothia fuscella]
MDGAAPPPPPPPPHGSPPPHGFNTKSSSGLPPGNYDIFIIPPHASGGGFLYLPSLRPNTNSFIAGAVAAFSCCYLYSVVAPTCKAVLHNVSQSGNGPAMVIFMAIVGAGAWYMGRMGHAPAPHSGGPTGGTHQAPPPQNGYPRGGPAPQQPSGAGYQGTPQGNASGSWGAPPPQQPSGAGFQGTPQGGNSWGAPPPQQANGAGFQGTPRGGSDWGGPSPQPQPQPGPAPGPQFGGTYGHQQHSQGPRTEPYGAAPRSESDTSERPKPRTRAYSNGSERWAKAKEETRKAAEAEKRQAELKKRQEEAERRKKEAERLAKAEADKAEWTKRLNREREAKEREAREKAAKERLEAKAKEEREEKERREAQEREEKERREAQEKAAREQWEAQEKAAKEQREAQEKAAKEAAEREARLQAARERIEKAKSERSVPTFGKGERTNPYDVDNNSNTPTPAAVAAQEAASRAAERKAYERPSAQSYVGTSTDQSHRPYDKPRPQRHGGSASSYYGSVYSESYAPSHSTARTSPPPSQRGPYSNKDPDKVQIVGVFKFSDSFPGKAEMSLVAGQAPWSDGIVLRLSTEALFVDDDVRGQGLREWDVKAWKISKIETTANPKNGLHILQFHTKDAAKTRYVYVLSESEHWKVDAGIKRLKTSPIVQQGLAHNIPLGNLSPNEANKLLQLVGLP